ncbi:MAG: efflux RND transporter periplasmic adaptor subunit [Sideroxyarcus sp.]|nr:efflux RND transporter periplasmic adaptor subunit [Sideroxyarcus sp.]
MKKSIIAMLVASLLIAAGAAIWFITKPKTEGMDSGPEKGAVKAVQVHSVEVTTGSVPIVLDAVGTVEADQSVAVRAEVSGVLQKIHFREGDLVKAGQLLFQIDPGVPQAEVDKARANLARDQAAANEAQAQVRRLEPLAAKEYVTQQEFAQAKAQEQSAIATVRADEAALKSVQLQLGYSRITSPISGRAGILNIKPGNLVSAASTTPLVTINATRPVMVSFSVPQQELQAIRQQQRSHTLTAEVRLDANGAVLAKGTLVFIDNAVDTQTGTIRMKARIPNDYEIIWPGELVSLRLILGIQKDALIIPESALQLGQEGSFVYAVVDGQAHMQAIKVARQLGNQIVVADGLEAGQQVIINPSNNLRPDSTVELIGAKNAAGAKSNEGTGSKPDATAGAVRP